MKKILGIAAVALFFLLILAAILFKFLKPTDSSTAQPTTVNFPVVTQAVGTNSQNPEQFVESFYQWYLLNFARDPLFPHPENRDQALSPWLSSNFLASWDDVQTEIDMNPVLLTTDDPSSWGSGITTKIASQSIRSSIIYVTLGTSPQQHSYRVEVIQDPTNGLWKIDSIASAE